MWHFAVERSAHRVRVCEERRGRRKAIKEGGREGRKGRKEGRKNGRDHMGASGQGRMAGELKGRAKEKMLPGHEDGHGCCEKGMCRPRSSRISHRDRACNPERIIRERWR